MPIPMLADFAVRLACGLAVLLLVTPWRVVPLIFFRTHCQIILGLLVLAALALWQFGASGTGLMVVVAAAVLAYFASIAWGLGLPYVALPLTAALALAGGGVLISASRVAGWEVWAVNASGRLASAFLLGSTLTAMLLGHHYLTAPAMSIDPLRRFVRCMAWSLGARAALAALGLGFWWEGWGVSSASTPSTALFLAIRWGMGVAGPALSELLDPQTLLTVPLTD